MLLQFTVENYMSFYEPTTFSMMAAENNQQHTEHLRRIMEGKGRSVLPLAAIYGANAAGKSNLIKAISFARKLILRGTRNNDSIPVMPFKLADTTNLYSSFEFIFLYQGTQYSYGFKVTSSLILEEWLFAKPQIAHKQESRLFERITSTDKETNVETGPTLDLGKSKQKQFLEFVAQGTRPNQLFLTEAAERNVREIAPVMEWFRKVLLIISAESEYGDLESTVHKDSEFANSLCAILKNASTGIANIIAEHVPIDIDRDLPWMSDGLRENLLDALNSEDSEGVRIRGSEGRYNLSKQDDQIMQLQLKVQHRAKDGRFVDFELKEESDGTQRLVHLVPALSMFKGDRPHVILIDELDRRLHPLLSRLLVEMALKQLMSNQEAQFIFTTHDTNLLDLDLLRRDEIWFVEKDQGGASHLYSLAEFKIRPDLKVQKGYLNGRFGAIPFIGDIDTLGWTSDNSSTVPDEELSTHAH